jgi:hypothetical protein
MSANAIRCWRALLLIVVSGNAGYWLTLWCYPARAPHAAIVATQPLLPMHAMAAMRAQTPARAQPVHAGVIVAPAQETWPHAPSQLPAVGSVPAHPSLGPHKQQLSAADTRAGVLPRTLAASRVRLAIADAPASALPIVQPTAADLAGARATPTSVSALAHDPTPSHNASDSGVAPAATSATPDRQLILGPGSELPVAAISDNQLALHTPAPAAEPPVSSRVRPLVSQPSAAPPIARAEIEALVVRGSLPASAVRRAVERIRSELAACYAHSAHDGKLGPGGRLQLSLVIDETGRTRLPRVSGAELPGLADCVSAAASRLVTRAPDTGVVNASIQLAFAR